MLGLVCGFGMLAKYSFALVAGAMLLAALSVPEARRALLSRGWWWAPLVGLLVVLPHVAWLLSHLTEATSGTISKMNIQPENGLVKGLLRLLEGVVPSTLLLWALFALWAFRSAWWQRPLAPVSPPMHRVFVRYLGLVLLALAGMVVFAGVSNFKGRWILPLLCMAPWPPSLRGPNCNTIPLHGATRSPWPRWPSSCWSLPAYAPGSAGCAARWMS